MSEIQCYDGIKLNLESSAILLKLLLVALYEDLR